jgi:hypothetical protein
MQWLALPFGVMVDALASCPEFGFCSQKEDAGNVTVA